VAEPLELSPDAGAFGLQLAAQHRVGDLGHEAQSTGACPAPTAGFSALPLAGLGRGDGSGGGSGDGLGGCPGPGMRRRVHGQEPFG
jgi:hypothetical protein